MNQILVTQKLYMTPELKRKKALYKFCFFISIFLLGILCSFYIYGMYEQQMDEALSQEILGAIDLQALSANAEEDENILVVALDEEVSDAELVEIPLEEKEPNKPLKATYTASNGKTYDIVGIITIPSIDISYPILAETTDALLKISVCKFKGPEPNEVGNLCIAGHNFTNTRAFSRINKLEKGEIIEITDLSGRVVKYEIYSTLIVKPTDLSATKQNTNGKREFTLITCTNGTKQRYLVKAVELEDTNNPNLSSATVITDNEKD